MNVFHREQTLDAERKTAIAVGLLNLTATVTYLTGSALIDSATNGPTSLIDVNHTNIRIGALLEAVNAVAVGGVGVLLFPILRKHHEGFALGYAGARVVESALLFVSIISPVLLIALSREYV